MRFSNPFFLKVPLMNGMPLGRALLGRRIREQVQVQTPGGLVRFEIIAIE